MQASEAVLALWAKSGEPSHSLLGHMLDTAAVTVMVLLREPARTRALYVNDLGLDEESTLGFLAATVAAHDLGKATPAFQMLWREGQRRVEAAGFPFSYTNLPPALKRALRVRHTALTQTLVNDLLVERGFDRRLARDIARCLGAHHGFLPGPGELSRTQMPHATGSGPWDAVRRELLGLVFATVGAHQVPGAHRLPAASALGIMALASFSDWISSDKAYFPYGRDAVQPAAYWQEARRLAEHALDALGWRQKKPLVSGPVSFEAVFPHPANDLQATVADLVARETSRDPEAFLLVIEAPTGTGKTEAALYAHLALQRAMGHRGLYVALPTMATGNQMFSRVKEWLEGLGRAEEPIDLQLQHGTAFLHSARQALQPRAMGDPPDGGGDPLAEPEDEESVVAAAWFSPAKRAMLSEYGVGTVDQALLGVLRIRHHFVRLWGLGNRTVVLDEVHAYDAYTSGLITALVAWLRQLGSSVILMSATLPPSRRRRLVEAYGARLPSPEHPYPRLTVVSGQRSESVRVDPGRAVTVWLRPAPRPVEQLAPAVLASVNGGGCAACIVNTVDRAQRLYRAMGDGELLREDGNIIGKRIGSTEVYLIHARFPGEERQAREAALLRRFGKVGYRERQRPAQSVVVATQVIEQSLDLDFDVLFADLAPVDLVLQRAGRLHRFDLAELSRQFKMLLRRPAGHTEPRLFVAELDKIPPNMTEEHWDRVYYLYVLLLSWWVLRQRGEIRVPEDVETLVEQVYEAGVPHDLPPDLRDAFEEARQSFEKATDQQDAWAQHAAIKDPVQLLADMPRDELALLRLDDGDEDAMSQVPLTRYGEPSVPVVLVHRVGQGLGLDPAGKTLAPIKGLLADDAAKRLFSRSVRLARSSIRSALAEQRPPDAWRKHPVLRNMRLVELDGYEASIGGTRIRLDPELGVVYLT